MDAWAREWARWWGDWWVALTCAVEWLALLVSAPWVQWARGWVLEWERGGTVGSLPNGADTGARTGDCGIGANVGDTAAATGGLTGG
jgi:hypothetical protein